MFSFFGLIADPIDDLESEVLQRWPDVSAVTIEAPLHAIVVRFALNHYDSSDEDIPELIATAVSALSKQYPEARFLLLRTECAGGDCANWGRVFEIEKGSVSFDTDGSEALRRLLGRFGVDVGPREIFAPLRRDFDWKRTAR